MYLSEMMFPISNANCSAFFLLSKKRMEDNEKMEKRVQDYTQEILDTIRSNSSPAVMGSRLEDYHENDLADVLPLLSNAAIRRLVSSKTLRVIALSPAG